MLCWVGCEDEQYNAPGARENLQWYVRVAQEGGQNREHRVWLRPDATLRMLLAISPSPSPSPSSISIWYSPSISPCIPHLRNPQKSILHFYKFTESSSYCIPLIDKKHFKIFNNRSISRLDSTCFAFAVFYSNPLFISYSHSFSLPHWTTYLSSHLLIILSNTMALTFTYLCFLFRPWGVYKLFECSGWQAWEKFNNSFGNENFSQVENFISFFCFKWKYCFLQYAHLVAVFSIANC